MKCLRSRKFWAHWLSQMSYFRCRAITSAADFGAAEVARLSRQEAAVSPLPRRNVFPRRTQRRREMATFWRQLAVLVGTGLPLKAALHALGDATRTARARLHRTLDVVPGTCVAVVRGARSRRNRQRAEGAAILVARVPLRKLGCAPRAPAMLCPLDEHGLRPPTALKIVGDMVAERRHAAAVESNRQGRSGRRRPDALAETGLLPLGRRLRSARATGDAALIAGGTAPTYHQKFGAARRMRTVGAVTTHVVGPVTLSVTGAPPTIAGLAT